MVDGICLSKFQHKPLSVHLRWLRAQKTRRPSSLHNTISSCISWCSGRLCWVTVIFQSTPDVHHGSMTVSQIISLEGAMVMCIQQWFLPLAFEHQDFPWLPESFHNITVDGEKPIFLHWLTISHKVWQKVTNHDPSLLAKTKPLVDAPFILNLDSSTVTS